MNKNTDSPPQGDVEKIRLLFAKYCNAKTLETQSNAMTIDAFAVAMVEALSQSSAKMFDEKQMRDAFYGGYDSVDRRDSRQNETFDEWLKIYRKGKV